MNARITSYFVASVAAGFVLAGAAACGSSDTSGGAGADGGDGPSSVDAQAPGDGAQPGADAADAATNDARANDAGSADSGIVVLPPSTAATYRDQDPRQGYTVGTLKFQNEMNDVTEYDVAWASAAGTDLGTFTTVTFSAPTSYAVALTTPPANATHFHIVAKTKSSTTRDLGYLRADNFAASWDVSVDGLDLVSTPSVVVDTVNQKLVILIGNASSGYGIRRCDLDGTKCATTRVFAGRPHTSSVGEVETMLAIDSVANQLAFVASSSDVGDPPALVRCALDATSCTATPLATTQKLGMSNGQIWLDQARGKLVVAGIAGGLYSNISILVCALDGTSCTGRSVLDYYANAFGYDSLRGNIIATQRVYVDGTTYPTAIAICDIAGSPCTSHTLTPPAIPNALGAGYIFYDASADHFVFVAGGYATVCDPTFTTCTGNALGGGGPAALTPAGLFVASGHDVIRCAADGTACTTHPGPAGGGKFWEASFATDGTHTFIVSSIANPWNMGFLWLDRCNLDGSGCTGTSLLDAAEARAGSGIGPRVAHNAKAGTVFIASSVLATGIDLPARLVRCSETGQGCVNLTIPVTSWGALVAANTLRGVFYDAGLDKLVVSAKGYSVVCDGTGANCATVNGLTGVILDEKNHALVDIEGTTLQRCPLDGSPCVTEGATATATWGQAIALDPIDGTIIGAGGDFSAATYISKCSGGTCPAGATITDLVDPQFALVDPADQSVLVFGFHAGVLLNNEAPWVTRCDKALKTCTTAAVHLDAGYQIASPSGAFDGTTGSLYLFTPDQGPEVPATLYRCARDATGCTTYDMAPGHTRFTANYLTLLNGHLFGTATDQGNDQRSRLMEIDPW